MTSEWFEVDVLCLSDPAQAVFMTIKRETGLGNKDGNLRKDHAKILDALLTNADTSALGLHHLFPNLFGPAPVWHQRQQGFVDITPTPHNVTIDIYGEEFHFKASADEARRLIKKMEQVIAVRCNVTRLKRALATAEAAAFNGVGIGEGIVVDDPGTVKPEAS